MSALPSLPLDDSAPDPPAAAAAIIAAASVIARLPEEVRAELCRSLATVEGEEEFREFLTRVYSRPKLFRAGLIAGLRLGTHPPRLAD